MGKPYATALNGQDHLVVLTDIIEERLNAVHSLASKNRMYLVDVVDPVALYWLASQFDVLGYKGWFLANDEQARRNLIKRAIELHRYKGTPWAVKESIKSLGFTDVVLIERAGLILFTYNGEITHNGDEEYGGDGAGEWATFKVIIDATDFLYSITGEYLVALFALIDEYKNVRSHLIGTSFLLNFEDELSLEDQSEDEGGNLIFEDILDGFDSYYDGEFEHDGEIDYDGSTDTLSIDDGTGGGGDGAYDDGFDDGFE